MSTPERQQSPADLAAAYLARLPADTPARAGEVTRLDGTREVRVEHGGTLARWWRAEDDPQ